MIGSAHRWRPTAGTEMLQLRASALARLRRFMADRQVLEVETPVLCDTAVTDPHIASLCCPESAGSMQPLYLRSSPEYHMKRMLAAGMPDIYQIGKAFRDGETGTAHQPEFTLIEWYRHGFDLTGMIDETCALVREIAVACGQTIAVTDRLRYRDLCLAETGCDPVDQDRGRFQHQAREALGQLLNPGLERALGDDRSGWLDLLMSHIVVPALDKSRLTVISHYPAAQAQLARLAPDDARFAERFELFYQGLELANGYRELTDSEEQAQRFQTDRQRRAALALDDVDPDVDFLDALENGLPDCCGVAVGFDRVLMACTGNTDITRVMGFAVTTPK